MLTYLGLIENASLHQQVRWWFTNTFGCTKATCVADIAEANSLCINHASIQAIITDLPADKSLRDHLREIRAFTQDKKRLRIIVVNTRAERIDVAEGDGEFLMVSLQRSEKDRWKVLRQNLWCALHAR